MYRSPSTPPALRRGTAAALLMIGIAAAVAIVIAPAGRRANAADDRCGIAEAVDMAVRPLPYVAQRIAQGGTLTIVALGSSSTSGTGASKPERNYPSRLAALLVGRYPGVKVRVINRGVAGEEARGMAARIERDVIAAKPDLVIWQVGSNGVLDEEDAAAVGEAVRDGIVRIKAAGSDVMLMNPQYAPAMLQHEHYRGMLHVLDTVAYSEDVPLFPRFAIMRHWSEDGRMKLASMLSHDRLHMNDASYDCLARHLASTIDRLAFEPG